MTFLGWFRPAARIPSPKLRDLVIRVDDLEADVQHLGHQLRKLRGRVTGGVRDDEKDKEVSPVGAAPNNGVPLRTLRHLRGF